MANAGLEAMRDPRRAIADKLTSQDGANAVGQLTATHEHHEGAHQMNDHVESNFGCFDNVAHMFRYTTTENRPRMSMRAISHQPTRIHPRQTLPQRLQAQPGDAALFESMLAPDAMQLSGNADGRVWRDQHADLPGWTV